jgi:hypothetical protein
MALPLACAARPVLLQKSRLEGTLPPSCYKSAMSSVYAYVSKVLELHRTLCWPWVAKSAMPATACSCIACALSMLREHVPELHPSCRCSRLAQDDKTYQPWTGCTTRQYQCRCYDACVQRHSRLVQRLRTAGMAAADASARCFIPRDCSGLCLRSASGHVLPVPTAGLQGAPDGCTNGQVNCSLLCERAVQGWQSCSKVSYYISRPPLQNCAFAVLAASEPARRRYY